MKSYGIKKSVIQYHLCSNIYFHIIIYYNLLLLSSFKVDCYEQLPKILNLLKNSYSKYM